MDIPNPRNFCGGNFQDWLEVNLINVCNAKCSWCIERNGYHPDHIATTKEIADAAIASGKKNIILLGGEPLLYKNIEELIGRIAEGGCSVWITTNGSRLTPEYVLVNLEFITGINISIHHYDLEKNKEITKLPIHESVLISSIGLLRDWGIHVRMNCNIIKGYIDTPEKIVAYVQWAKKIGAGKVRFAELKQDDEEFIDLAAILDHKYGLNDNPFTLGCNSDCVIEGIPVNFRQMCGLQTSRRIAPENPKQFVKEVLYYDGIMYKGWQTRKEMNSLKYRTIQALTHNKLTDSEIRDIIMILIGATEEELQRSEQREAERPKGDPKTGAGCQY
jgi:pyruvate-formate lyase-activating enzyme